METSYPRDPEWEAMPDVGLEVWPHSPPDTAAYGEARAQALQAPEVERPFSENPANEALDIPRSQERALSYRVSALMASLARLNHCDDEPTQADMRLIQEQRMLVAMQLAGSPSLQQRLTNPAWVADCWSDALASLGAIGVQVENLPEDCPWDQDALLDGPQQNGRNR